MSLLGMGLVMVLIVIAFAIGVEMGSGGVSWGNWAEALRRRMIRRELVAVQELLGSAMRSLSVDDYGEALDSAEKRIAKLVADLQRGGDEKL